jgi:hypothetical protein
MKGIAMSPDDELQVRVTKNDLEIGWPSAGDEPSRSDCLVKACYSVPRRFHRIDAMSKVHGEHQFPDEDGDMISRSVTVDLLDDVDVLVMIRPDLDRRCRVRLIAKILEEEALRASGDEDPIFPWPPAPLKKKVMPGLDFEDDDDLL